MPETVGCPRCGERHVVEVVPSRLNDGVPHRIIGCPQAPGWTLLLLDPAWFQPTDDA